MPTVTVMFSGICTFLTVDYPQLDGHVRAVLVDASNGATVAGQQIPPHIAKVQIGDGAAPIQVKGLHMRLVTSSAEAVRILPFTTTAPNLRELVAQSGGTLPSPRTSVAFGHDAAVYFDFRAGTLHACTNSNRAVITKLIVDATEIALENTPFPGRQLPAGLPPRIEFSEDVTIYVQNDDATESKRDVDFLLHYLVADHHPANPPIPSTEQIAPCPEPLPGALNSIGAGCSNSNYP